MSRGDPAIRIPIGAVSYPATPNDVATTVSVVPANDARTITVTVTPPDKRLGIWNFLHSIFVDTDNIDYIFSSGVSLTAAQRKLVIQAWVDWALSSDQNNIRVYRVRIQNEDSSDHTCYFYVKSYTFATVIS